MKTKTFIQLLKENPGKQLHFTYPHIGSEGIRNVPPTYHITEIKHLDINSVDCGGYKHRLKETVIQLLVNDHEPLRKAWTTNKALSIIEIVNNAHALDPEASLFFEYSDESRQRVIHQIHQVGEKHDSVTVHLGTMPTVCKPSQGIVSQEKVTTGCC